MPDFTMPSLGADMTEGTLQEWLVRPGDTVRRGDVVAVVETAKSTIEVECFASGTVERLLVEPGTTVPVGTPLARIGAGERAVEPPAPPAPEPVRPAPPAPEPVRPATPVEEPVAPVPPVEAAREPAAPVAPVEPALPVEAARESAGPGGPVPPVEAPAAEAVHSPLVRRQAAREGVDLRTLHGTGPAGTITRADVGRAAAAAHPAAPPGARPRVTPFARRLAGELGVDPARVPPGAGGVVRAADVRRAARAAPPPAPAVRAPAAEPSRTGARDRAAAMRRAIGDLMSRSKHEIPHYYLSTTVDLAAAQEWMHDHNRHCPVTERLVPAALLLKAAARAAREVPQLNGFWTDGRFHPAPAVHLGVAIALHGGGLVAPALHDADTLPLPEVMARLKDLTWRARSGRLRASETTDPTLTVTSLGDQGVEAVFGVIYPPQVALVGFGRVTARPCAVDGLLGVRPAVTATLSADHRASDGAVGARYLAAVDRLLQQPEEL